MPRISAALALGIAVFSRRASATAGEGTCAALLVAERPFMWDAGATAGAAERVAAAAPSDEREDGWGAGALRARASHLAQCVGPVAPDSTVRHSPAAGRPAGSSGAAGPRAQATARRPRACSRAARPTARTARA